MALTSARMVERSVSKRSVKWVAGWKPVASTSSSGGSEVAVVSQRPGS